VSCTLVVVIVVGSPVVSVVSVGVGNTVVAGAGVGAAVVGAGVGDVVVGAGVVATAVVVS